MWGGIRKWEIINPDDPDQDNEAKLIKRCIVIGPGQEVSIFMKKKKKKKVRRRRGKKKLGQLPATQVTVASPWHEPRPYDPPPSFPQYVGISLSFLTFGGWRWKRDPSCFASCSWASLNHLGRVPKLYNVLSTRNYILSKGCATINARNHGQMSSSRPGSDAVWNSLRSERFLTCHVFSRQRQIFE
ncbi:hypothetical protein TNCV_1370021 [Trichonephila clavipes]|nr:hypothetical protein TNCV_1370021 [Trichonephila clavipes]